MQGYEVMEMQRCTTTTGHTTVHQEVVVAVAAYAGCVASSSMI